MYDIASPELMTSLALVPEQLCGYVRAVSGMRLRFCRGMAVYLYGDEAVLAAYPPASALCGEGLPPAFLPGGFPSATSKASAEIPPDDSQSSQSDSALPGAFFPEPGFLDEAIKEVAAWEGLRKLTVLAPFRPPSAPRWAVSGPEQPDGKAGDCYYSLELPFFRPDGEAPGQKLRNMLRRAGRELEVAVEDAGSAWENGCRALLDETLRSRNLPPGTRHIYGQISSYLESVPGAVLFTARERAAKNGGQGGGPAAGMAEPADMAGMPSQPDSPDLEEARSSHHGGGPGKLHGFCVGDFSALDTAFYMFAFRAPLAAPGTADLLLAALVREAEKLGHRRVNLGLCINGGIAFFKRKWGAQPFLPYVETSWELKSPGRGFLARLFRRG